MANPNRQSVERDHLITVTLVGTDEAVVFIRQPSGNGQRAARIDRSLFLGAGMTEGQAIDRALEIVAIGVRGSV